MDPRDRSQRHGIRLALRVAALTAGAGAATMALTATPARASDPAEAAAVEPALEPMQVRGFNCTSPGPLAPPLEPRDYGALLAAVPA